MSTAIVVQSNAHAVYASGVAARPVRRDAPPPHAPTTPHEAFVHAVREIAADRVADAATRERLLAAKLVYGSGGERYRGICYYRAGRNDADHDLIQVPATGEESRHEAAHVLAGPDAGRSGRHDR